ncbi:MAG: cell division protein SepF [Bacillota bacterium]
MGKSLYERFLNLIGIEEEETEEEFREEVVSETVEEVEDERETLWERKKRGSVVSLPSPQRPVKVVVAEPTSFEEVSGIAEHLKQKRPVLVNLELADREVARRIIDFLSGTTFALSGVTQKVSNGVFLFAPNNVDVDASARMIGREDESLPWSR